MLSGSKNLKGSNVIYAAIALQISKDILIQIFIQFFIFRYFEKLLTFKNCLNILLIININIKIS